MSVRKGGTLNYLAHLYLAQPTADSCFGNLLGDFRRGVDVSSLPKAVEAGLNNHMLVDRITDRHDAVREAKQLFGARHRRFAGIMLDVVFDHFLIKDWDRYHHQTFDDFCQQAYALLAIRVGDMPPAMQRVVNSMITHQWLENYRKLEGVGYALDRIAQRIRFANDFAGSVEELERHYDELQRCFDVFFPKLTAQVELAGLE